MNDEQKNLFLEKESEALCKLERTVMQYKVFIDTSSLMDNSFIKFRANVAPLLTKYNKSLFVIEQVINEIEAHKSGDDITKAILAEQAAFNLQKLDEQGFAEVLNSGFESIKNHADNEFLVIFNRQRLTEKLLLITQDKALAEDLLRINDQTSVKANYIHVMRINRYGFLSNFMDNSCEKNDVLPPKNDDVHLSKIYFSAQNVDDCLSGGNAVVPEGYRIISSKAFSGRRDIISVVLPNTIETIEDCAFYGCSNLTSVYLPGKLNFIGEYAFAYTNISNIKIPISIHTISDFTFKSCVNLKNMEFSNHCLKNIGVGAFWGCEFIRFSEKESFKEINDYAFYGCKNLRIRYLTGADYIGFAAFGNTSVPYVFVSENTRVNDSTSNENTKILRWRI